MSLNLEEISESAKQVFLNENPEEISRYKIFRLAGDV
jgi:hypothetical protein